MDFDLNPTYLGDNKKPKSAPELDQLAIPIEVDYSTEQNAGNTANSIASYYYKENVGANDIGSSSSIADRRFSGFGLSSSSPWGTTFGQYGNKLHWRKKRQTLPESPLFSKIWPTLYTNGKVTFGQNWKNNIFGMWVPDETNLNYLMKYDQLK